TPWPRIRQPQCAHVGAIACAAHSKLSNTPLRWPCVTVNAPSYSLPQTSQAATMTTPSRSFAARSSACCQSRYASGIERVKRGDRPFPRTRHIAAVDAWATVATMATPRRPERRGGTSQRGGGRIRTCVRSVAGCDLATRSLHPGPTTVPSFDRIRWIAPGLLESLIEQEDGVPPIPKKVPQKGRDRAVRMGNGELAL